MVNPFARYQVGLTLKDLFPSRLGECACGCGSELTKPKKKWASDKCRDNAYIQFAVVKGDPQIIRSLLFERDKGACVYCGEITDNWQADHIKPVFQGGGASDISNFQTLCLSCHKIKTYYNLSHHKAISSHAASMRLKCCFPDF